MFGNFRVFGFGTFAAADPRIDACGPVGKRRWLCDLVSSQTDRYGIARTAHWLSPFVAAVLIAVGALIVVKVVRVVMRRVAVRAVAIRPGASNGRRAQRADTIAEALGSLSAIVIAVVAVFAIIGAFGIDLAPLLAGAGLAGVVFGFGAQNLLRDVIAGTFMVFEDQFGVGDDIDVGVASGVVEGVTLRVTRLRDAEGVVWHVPNGSILRVANHSQP